MFPVCLLNTSVDGFRIVSSDLRWDGLDQGQFMLLLRLEWEAEADSVRLILADCRWTFLADRSADRRV
jgi:hypothetical protein